MDTQITSGTPATNVGDFLSNRHEHGSPSSSAFAESASAYQAVGNEICKHPSFDGDPCIDGAADKPADPSTAVSAHAEAQPENEAPFGPALPHITVSSAADFDSLAVDVVRRGRWVFDISSTRYFDGDRASGREEVPPAVSRNPPNSGGDIAQGKDRVMQLIGNRQAMRILSRLARATHGQSWNHTDNFLDCLAVHLSELAAQGVPFEPRLYREHNHLSDAFMDEAIRACHCL